jgi:hypothetical protein
MFPFILSERRLQARRLVPMPAGGHEPPLRSRSRPETGSQTMMKPISTRTHGIIDYAYGGALIALPFLMRWNRRAARLSIGAGLATLGVTMMTNYECGVIRLLPMKAHLAMDAAETSMLIGAPRTLGSMADGAGRVLAVLGALGAAVGAMTETRSPYERRELPA